MGYRLKLHYNGSYRLNSKATVHVAIIEAHYPQLFSEAERFTLAIVRHPIFASEKRSYRQANKLAGRVQKPVWIVDVLGAKLYCCDRLTLVNVDLVYLIYLIILHQLFYVFI